jgi:hypothetical protein
MGYNRGVSKKKMCLANYTHAGANDPDDGHRSSLNNDRAEQGTKGPQKSEGSKCELS